MEGYEELSTADLIVLSSDTRYVTMGSMLS